MAAQDPENHQKSQEEEEAQSDPPEDTISHYEEAPILSPSPPVQPTAVLDKAVRHPKPQHESQEEEGLLPSRLEDTSLHEEKAPVLDRKEYRELKLPMSDGAGEQVAHRGGPRTSKTKRENRYSSFKDYLGNPEFEHPEDADTESMFSENSSDSGAESDNSDRTLLGRVRDVELHAAIRIIKQYHARSLHRQGGEETTKARMAVGLPGPRLELSNNLKVVSGDAIFGAGPSRGRVHVDSGYVLRDSSIPSLEVQPATSEPSSARLHGGIPNGLRPWCYV